MHAISSRQLGVTSIGRTWELRSAIGQGSVPKGKSYPHKLSCQEVKAGQEWMSRWLPANRTPTRESGSTIAKGSTPELAQAKPEPKVLTASQGPGETETYPCVRETRLIASAGFVMACVWQKPSTEKRRNVLQQSSGKALTLGVLLL